MNITTIKILNKIKNHLIKNSEYVEFTTNDFVIKILKSLYINGLINSYSIKTKKTRVYLRYVFNNTLTSKLKIISKPSLRIILSYDKILKLNDCYRSYFFSTPLGVLSLKECKKYGTGGILLFIC